MSARDDLRAALERYKQFHHNDVVPASLGLADAARKVLAETPPPTGDVVAWAVRGPDGLLTVAPGRATAETWAAEHGGTVVPLVERDTTAAEAVARVLALRVPRHLLNVEHANGYADGLTAARAAIEGGLS